VQSSIGAAEACNLTESVNFMSIIVTRSDNATGGVPLFRWLVALASAEKASLAIDERTENSTKASGLLICINTASPGSNAAEVL
jgi:hypothetical protein